MVFDHGPRLLTRRGHPAAHAVDPNPFFILPFGVLLACIALGPFLFKD